MSTQSQGPSLTRVPDDVEAWPAQILSAMHQHFPFLGNYDLDFHMTQQDPEAGYGYGAVAVRNITASTLPGVGLGGNYIRIPFVVDGFLVKKPMAFEVGGTLYALTESRVRSAMLTTAIGTSPENPMVRSHSLVDDLMPPQATRQGGMTQTTGMGSGAVKTAAAEAAGTETIEPELKYVRDDWERRWVRQFKDTPLYQRAIEAVQDSPEQLSAEDAQRALDQAKRSERRAVLSVLTTRMGAERARLQIALNAISGTPVLLNSTAAKPMGAGEDGDWCVPFQGTALYEEALKLQAQMTMLAEAEAATWDETPPPGDSKWTRRSKTKRALETELAVWRYESVSGKKLAPIAAKVVVDVLDLEKTAAMRLHFTADNEITKSFKPTVPMGYRTFTVPGSKFVISVPAALAKRLLATKSVAETHKLLLPAMLESLRAVKAGKPTKALLLWVVDAQGNAVQQKVPLQKTAEADKTAGKAGVRLATMLSNFDAAPKATPRRPFVPKGKARPQPTAPSPEPSAPTTQPPKPGWRPDRVHAAGAGIVTGAIGFDRLQDNGNKYAGVRIQDAKDALEHAAWRAKRFARDLTGAEYRDALQKVRKARRELSGKIEAAEKNPNAKYSPKLNLFFRKEDARFAREDMHRARQQAKRGAKATAAVGTGVLALAAAKHLKNKKSENPDGVGKEASAYWRLLRPK